MLYTTYYIKARMTGNLKSSANLPVTPSIYYPVNLFTNLPVNPLTRQPVNPSTVIKEQIILFTHLFTVSSHYECTTTSFR